MEGIVTLIYTGIVVILFHVDTFISKKYDFLGLRNKKFQELN